MLEMTKNSLWLTLQKLKEQQKQENTDSELSKTSRQQGLEIVYVLYVKSHLHSKVFSHDVKKMQPQSLLVQIGLTSFITLPSFMN